MFQTLDIQKTGLSLGTIKQILELLSKVENLELCVIYGSRAKGNFKNGSDIDLCLFGNNLKAEILLRLEQDLDELMLPYTFDICIYQLIDNPNLKEHIDRVGMIFYKA